MYVPSIFPKIRLTAPAHPSLWRGNVRSEPTMRRMTADSRKRGVISRAPRQCHGRLFLALEVRPFPTYHVMPTLNFVSTMVNIVSLCSRKVCKIGRGWRRWRTIPYHNNVVRRNEPVQYGTRFVIHSFPTSSVGGSLCSCGMVWYLRVSPPRQRQELKDGACIMIS